MTSRPPLAVNQRQPQRTLSGSGLSQRPQQQRTLSQQYLPPSPIRKNDAASLESNGDAADVAQGARYGTGTPRRGGSRLKLELANASFTSASFSESPQALDPSSGGKPFTPSRLMPGNETPDLGDLASQPSQAQTVDGDSAPLPMPPRRARFVPAASRPKTPPTSTPAVKKDIRPKPFHLEAPAAAPRYKIKGKPDPVGYADFFPWNGDHPEDKFSENVIKHGFYDKVPLNTGIEVSSAKSAIFPFLKHKSGLQGLSTLFTSIMHQRKQSGQVNAPSTFKPPPRVTLTDTKRELWLKDLANPAISLRRLSRTIPHGIRGKALLDQCLNKNVPTDRAVWLAKCVGANEIRAFKRKGVNGTFVMGGEAKWIKDWTQFVEQFVDSVVGAFEEAEWKTKVTYAIRLATHLYAEHLLDRDHYMEWLVSGLEASSQARLPMWLLVVRIYWKDLTKLRRYGRRLAAALLNHNNAITVHPDRDVLQPLHSQLKSLLNSVLLMSPASFVSPATWSKYRTTLQASIAGNDEPRQATYRSIQSRNERITMANVRSSPAVRGKLVKLLDDTLRLPFPADLPSKCWNVSDNKTTLVKTVLEWSTSLYRSGITKVYVAARILRSWSDLDMDITECVLSFFDTDPLAEQSRKLLVYHLVAELARTDHFSVARYIQWLIARGGVGEADIVPDGPCATRLIVELPLACLSESLKSLRASVLGRAWFNVDDEARDIDTAKRCLQYAMSFPLDPTDPLLQKKPMSIKKLGNRIGLSSYALKSEIAAWLTSIFGGTLTSDVKTGKAAANVPASQFGAARNLLEATQDFATLAQVVRRTSESFDVELLAACVDTINLHFPVFAALGATRELFDTLLDRFKATSEEQGTVAARPLLASLTLLAPRIPELKDLAQQLHNDLVRIDRSNAVDASSPLSDNMATQLQDEESELGEQIEKLASYTSADRPTMERLFQAIINRFQSLWQGKADERQRACCVLLSRLRVFDHQHFDVLMTGWVQHIRKLTIRPALPQIFPPLISSGCLSVSILLNTTLRRASLAQQTQVNGMASIYTQEILQLLTNPPAPEMLLTTEESYRFRIIQQKAKHEYSQHVMALVRCALAEYSVSRTTLGGIDQPLDDEQTQSHLLNLLGYLILVDPMAASQTLTLKSPDPKLASLIDSIATRLLIPNGNGEQNSVDQVLELANDFTLPFCQVKLSLTLAGNDSSASDAAERQQSQQELLSAAVDKAIEANNIMWTGMLSSMSPEVTQHIRARAEARFLDILPSLKATGAMDMDTDKSLPMIESLLVVIDSIARSGGSSKQSPLSSAVVDKLSDMWEILTSSNPEHATLKASVYTHYLPLLFSYMTLNAAQSAQTQVAAGTNTNDPAYRLANETRARAVLNLAGIMQEIESDGSSMLPSNKELSEQAFDLALVLVDSLSEEARLNCVRAVKDATSDPRIRYLFSFQPNPSENLMLCYKEKVETDQRQRMMMMMGAWSGLGISQPAEKLNPFIYRRWEILNEPTPNIGENDTALSLGLFEARKVV